MNNKGANQPAHPRSLISAFFVRCLYSIIPLVSISKFSSLYQVSVAAQANLSLTWSETPKAGFLLMRLNRFTVLGQKYLSCLMTKPKWPVRPAKTQISLGIRPAHPGWSEYSLDAQSLCWFCHVLAHFLHLFSQQAEVFHLVSVEVGRRTVSRHCMTGICI